MTHRCNAFTWRHAIGPNQSEQHFYMEQVNRGRCWMIHSPPQAQTGCLHSLTLLCRWHQGRITLSHFVSFPHFCCGQQHTDSKNCSDRGSVFSVLTSMLYVDLLSSEFQNETFHDWYDRRTLGVKRIWLNRSIHAVGTRFDSPVQKLSRIPRRFLTDTLSQLCKIWR